MHWKKFKDEMPKNNSRLLICGTLNTDPLTPPDEIYNYMEFVDFKDNVIISDDDGQPWYAPDEDTYWIYQSDIVTPFNDRIFNEKNNHSV